jgi:hypothetical protein
VTVNDLLLRDLFLAMLAWNEQHRPGRPGRWLQVNMPINMRNRLKNPMPAANKMSYAFLARRTRDIADPKALLDGIRRETGFIKQWGLGIYFLAGLSWALKIPGAVPRMVAGKRCFATAVLTNLGDFRRRMVASFPRVRGRLMIGDLVLERIRVVAPIRPRTHASFAVITYADELNIDVRCDPKRFSLTASRRLLDLYVHFIKRSLAGS